MPLREADEGEATAVRTEGGDMANDESASEVDPLPVAVGLDADGDATLRPELMRVGGFGATVWASVILREKGLPGTCSFS